MFINNIYVVNITTNFLKMPAHHNLSQEDDKLFE